jgi:hypothetical protein
VKFFKEIFYALKIANPLIARITKTTKEKKALYQRDISGILNYPQTVPNAPISGLTGPMGYSSPSPRKKRKTQEDLFSQAPKEHASRQTSQTL